MKYEIILYWSEGDNAYIAEVPELAGCMADGPHGERCAAQRGADRARVDRDVPGDGPSGTGSEG